MSMATVNTKTPAPGSINDQARQNEPNARASLPRLRLLNTQPILPVTEFGVRFVEDLSPYAVKTPRLIVVPNAFVLVRVLSQRFQSRQIVEKRHIGSHVISTAGNTLSTGMEVVNACAVGDYSQQIPVLECPEVVLSRPRDIIDRFIGTAGSRHKTGFFSLLLKQSRQGDSIRIGLFLPLRRECVVGIDTDSAQNHPQLGRLEGSGNEKRTHKLVEHGYSLAFYQPITKD
jgi:hypothetical protein